MTESFDHLIAISAVEHPSVREPAKSLQRQGWQVCEIAVDSEGVIDPADYAATLAKNLQIISIMLANNETGVMQNIPQLAEQAKSTRAWFHSDAVQAFGKVPVNFRAMNLHALTISAHKIGGAKGAAALIVDKRVDLAAQILGGGHERGLRSGTENVAAIAGFGKACEIAMQRLDREPQRITLLRDELLRGLAGQGATIFGAEAKQRLPNTVLFSIPNIDGETLVSKLDRAGFAVASGAACSSTDPEPSHVLRAMNIPADIARGAVRVSLGQGNTQQHIQDFLTALQSVVAQLKGLTALVD
jgi:cysteine desulfurase